MIHKGNSLVYGLVVVDALAVKPERGHFEKEGIGAVILKDTHAIAIVEMDDCLVSSVNLQYQG